MMRARVFVAAAVCATAVVGAGASVASAGEVTGNCNNAPQGAAAANCKSEYSQGASICKFSGQNDNPDSTDPRDPGGPVQSYGYSVVREGGKAFAPSPGFACNPNNGFGE
jgi:hypothetical protein